LVGVAVNVTEVPAQIVDPELLIILTDTGVVGVTVIVTALLVAVVAVTQVSELVMIHVITSPFANPLVV
jgi:hypothetical protein